VSASCHLAPQGFRGAYRSDPLARAVYSEAAGIARIVPAAVAVPQDIADVVTVVKWAGERSLSLVPRGSGTSMAGGAVGPGVIVDMSRMSHIGTVDPLQSSRACGSSAATHSIRVGPGALRGAVNRAAADHGLRFPVDPSSGEYCTIGGMVSTNAAGAHTLAFGATRQWVLALDCVFDDGSEAHLERGAPAPGEIPALERFIAQAEPQLRADGAARRAIHEGVSKESSGYGIAAWAETGDVIDLIVGSEGTLAMVVGVELALMPAATATGGVLGAFDSLDDAVKAATQARAMGAVACELLDRTFLEVATKGSMASLASIPPGTEAVLLAEVEGESDEAAGSAAHSLGDVFTSCHATIVRVAEGPGEQHEIWELRHAASPILSSLDPSLKSMQLIEDGAVPAESLARYVRGVRSALERRGVRGVIFGHAGNSHIHVNPLIQVADPAWRENAEGLLDEIVSLTARLGGTLAAEHGDGRLRTPLLPRVWSRESLDLFSLVKKAFDPLGIFNPGVKVPLASQKPVADIKYDPSLAPLPERARAALDRVSSNRDYAALRLDLI